MTTSRWRLRSRMVIAAVMRANVGADAPTIRRALREAYPFGERRMTPYKIWLEEVRRALGVAPTPNAPDPRQIGLEEVEP